ncbi:TMEM175 family protein [Nonomuraea sp. NPDC026600]|uniref:TMEM175 family protein n=1 Tax=Nonomuraea sp. NPDC026600 TaxID=3155363 RepID=UPI0033F3D591
MPPRLWRRPEISESASEVERIAFFSDAVFAIAITLLVVELSVPEEPLADLSAALWERAPKFFAFVLSFLVIGQYWITHHRMFRHVRRYDQILMWLNLVYLLGVAFLPFPTALLGNYFSSPMVGLIYGLSLFAPSTLSAALWHYAKHRSLLDDISPALQREIQLKTLATPVVFLLGAGAALIHIYLSVACWLVLLPLVRLLVRVRPAGA